MAHGCGNQIAWGHRRAVANRSPGFRRFRPLASVSGTIAVRDVCRGRVDGLLAGAGNDITRAAVTAVLEAELTNPFAAPQPPDVLRYTIERLLPPTPARAGLPRQAAANIRRGCESQALEVIDAALL